MFNLQGIKKTSLLLIFSAAASALITNQGASACETGFCTQYGPNEPYVTDDFTMQEYTYNQYVGHGQPPVKVTGYKSVNRNTSNIVVNDSKISFLKFDISNLKDEYLAGKQINASRFSIFGSGEGTLNLYFVANDAWVDESQNKTKVDPAFINSLLSSESISATVDSQNDSDIIFNFSPDFIGLLNSNLADSSDNYFSLALKADDKFILNSSEACLSKPQLEVAYAPDINEGPVPEPSSMVLGIMGLGSMLGFRRRK